MQSIPFSIRVSGPMAMFTVPHLRSDPYSEPVMTPSAAKGILKSIYWKPEGEWEIERICVLAPIRYSTSKEHARADWTSDKHTLLLVTRLVDVDYIIDARWVPNPHRVDVGTYHKKYGPEILRRMSQGQAFRQPHLGVTDHPASWSLLTSDMDRPKAIDRTEDLGTMLFDLLPINVKKDEWEPVFFRAKLEAGVVHVPEALYAKHRDRVMRSRDTFFPRKKSA
jgi:CRISPR-associated protein Cas5d